jgi:hypothetical protein
MRALQRVYRVLLVDKAQDLGATQLEIDAARSSVTASRGVGWLWTTSGLVRAVGNDRLGSVCSAVATI